MIVCCNRCNPLLWLWQSIKNLETSLRYGLRTKVTTSLQPLTTDFSGSCNLSRLQKTYPPKKKGLLDLKKLILMHRPLKNYKINAFGCLREFTLQTPPWEKYVGCREGMCYLITVRILFPILLILPFSSTDFCQALVSTKKRNKCMPINWLYDAIWVVLKQNKHWCWHLFLKIGHPKKKHVLHTKWRIIIPQ